MYALFTPCHNVAIVITVVSVEHLSLNKWSNTQGSQSPQWESFMSVRIVCYSNKNDTMCNLSTNIKSV